MEKANVRMFLKTMWKIQLCLFFRSALFADPLIKDGNGILTLSAPNTSFFTGDTLINAGTLALSGDGTLSTFGTVTLAAGAVFDISASNATQIIGALEGAGHVILGNIGLSTGGSGASTSFTGILSGSGFLIKTSSGTFTISGPNTYTGGTFIEGGTLSLEAVNTLPLNRNLTLTDNATLLLNDNSQQIGGLSSTTASTTVNLGALNTTVLTIGANNSSSSFGGASGSGGIIGSGSIVKLGIGTQILLGNNSYSGGTQVSSGALEGNSNSLRGAISNSASIVFNQTFDGIFSGTITGIGTATKRGNGALTLSEGLINQSSVNLQEGTTILNETLIGALTIDSGTILTGSGPILGTVSNFGAINPGNGVGGSLSISGPYRQEGGSSLEIEFNPAAADRLSVTGSVTILDNATLILSPSIGDYSPNTNFIILQGSLGLSGQFALVQNSLPAFQTLLLYSPTSVLLSVNLVPFIVIIKNGNAAAIAQCIDNTPTVAGTDFKSIVDFLRFMTLGQLGEALNEMQPSLFNDLSLAQENDIIQYRSSIVRRLNDLYWGKCNNSEKIHFWEDTYFYRTNQKSIGSEVGYKTETKTAAIGLDYFFTPHRYIGLTAACSYDRLHWLDARGHATLTEFSGGIYGGLRDWHMYMQASALASYNVNRATRQIHLLTIDPELFQIRNASHKNRGLAVDGYLEIGLDLGEKIHFKPFMRGDFVYLFQEAFSEHGAGSIDLTISHQNSDYLRLEPGIELLSCFYSDASILWVPYLKIGWVLERRFTGKTLNANLINSSCIFTVEGLNPNRHLIAPAAGLTASFFNKAFELGFEYAGEYSSHFKNHTLGGRICLNF